MTCVSSVSYSVLINGAPTKPFRARMGLRQEDPMSPFSFAIAMEYFSRLLHKVKGHDIKFHSKCKKSGVMELLFANDLLVFTQPDTHSLSSLRKIINDFARVFGLHINNNKSAIYLAGVTEEEEVDILESIGVPKGELSFRYLGFPLTSKRLGIHDCKPIVDKIIARIHHWTSRKLSMVGF